MADPLQAFMEQNKGLLSFEPTEDDRKKALTYGLIGAGLGILSANAQNPRGAGFAGAVGGAAPGLQMYQQTLQNAPKERMQNLAGMMQMAKLRKDMESTDLLRKFYQPQQANNFQPAQGALDAGAAVGDFGPTVTNAQRIPPSPQIQSGPPNFGALLAAGVRAETVKAMMENWKLQNPENQVSGGYVFNPREVTPNTFLPRVEFNQQGQGVGITPNAQGGLPTMAPLPGSMDTFNQFQRASRGAEADFRLRDIPMAGGGSTLMTEGEYIRSRQPQATAPRAVNPALANLTPAERQAVETLQADLARGRTGSITVPASQSSAGIGQIPTSSVLGVSQSEAQKEAEKQRAVGAVKRTEELPQARLRVQTQFDDFRRLNSLATEIMNSGDLPRSVGIVGAFPSIPGSGAANVDSMIDSLKAQISGMKLQAMRDASKTGGAVGQVTEREWPRLENMITALNSKMEPSLFRQKLSELIVEIKNAQNNVLSAYQSEYGESIQQEPTRPKLPNDPLGLFERRKPARSNDPLGILK